MRRFVNSILASLSLHAAVVVPVVAVGALIDALDATPALASIGSDEVEGEDEESDVFGGGSEVEVYTEPIRVSMYVEPGTQSVAAAIEQATSKRTTGASSQATKAQPTGEGIEGYYSRHYSDRKGASSTGQKGEKKPCDPEPAIAQVDGTTWTVERAFVDWYASHLAELNKIAEVYPSDGDDGKRNGFRLGLPRCSVLRQGGLRSGDVVHEVNGRRVNDIPQAVAAYFALRNDSVIRVKLTRKGQPLTLKFRLK